MHVDGKSIRRSEQEDILKNAGKWETELITCSRIPVKREPDLPKSAR